MRFSKSDITVIVLCMCVLLISLAWFGHHTGENARRGMVGSVEFSLNRIFTEPSELRIRELVFDGKFGTVQQMAPSDFG
jgi:hypothetical protein